MKTMPRLARPGAHLLLFAAMLALPTTARAIDTDYLFSFGGPGAGNGQFNSPTEIAIGPSGAVYVLDGGNGRIQKFDAEGNYLTQWVSARPFQGPMNSICATTDGSVYVQSNLFITKYDADGNYVTWWSITSSSSQSHHLESDRLGFFYLSYTVNGSYQTLRYVGPQQTSGGFGSGSIAFLRIAVDPAGQLFWAGYDMLTSQFRIYKRTSTGAAIADWPSALVRDMACDISGNLYACEWQNHLVRVYDNAGGELATIGQPGTSPGQFQLPTDVAVGTDGRIYVVDHDNHRVQVFGNGSTPAVSTSWGRVKAGYRN